MVTPIFISQQKDLHSEKTQLYYLKILIFFHFNSNFDSFIVHLHRFLSHFLKYLHLKLYPVSLNGIVAKESYISTEFFDHRVQSTKKKKSHFINFSIQNIFLNFRSRKLYFYFIIILPEIFMLFSSHCLQNNYFTS